MKRHRRVTLVLIGIVTVVVPLGVSIYLVLSAPPNESFADRTTIFSELLTPLFSVFAFGGLIYTALLQSEELGLQRKELENTREELKRTADAQEASVKTLSEQVRATWQTARLNAALALNEHTERMLNDELNRLGKAHPDTENASLEAMDRLFTLMDEIEGQSKAATRPKRRG